MGLHRSAGHFELAGDLVVIAPLQKQFHDLLFALPEPDRCLAHTSPSTLVSRGDQVRSLYARQSLRLLGEQILLLKWYSQMTVLTAFHSTHNANYTNKLL